MARRALALLLGTVFIGALALQPQVARTETSVTGQRYIPSLGDLMGTMQLRHIKLWLAGKRRNWELASYELNQMNASFSDIGTLYSGIPIADMTPMSPPVARLADAIRDKNTEAFAKAYGEMTKACNNCHQAIDRKYIVMRVPDASPFSDQEFAPPK
jgi:hypothetical protein